MALDNCADDTCLKTYNFLKNGSFESVLANFQRTFSMLLLPWQTQILFNFKDLTVENLSKKAEGFQIVQRLSVSVENVNAIMDSVTCRFGCVARSKIFSRNHGGGCDSGPKVKPLQNSHSTDTHPEGRGTKEFSCCLFFFFFKETILKSSQCACRTV